jgi:hypothetical protein
MAANTETVTRAWLEGRNRGAGAMSTDGSTIYSYALAIGYTASEGRKIGIENASGSATTSRHRNAVLRQAEGRVILEGHSRSQCSGQCKHI